MKGLISAFMMLSTVASLSGCGEVSGAASRSDNSSAADGSKYMLTEEPDEAIGIIEARESANDGDSIVVVGRIGGTTNPWVNGRAAFMLLDASMVLVAEGTENGDGEICTGDCCAAERAHATMLVKIVGDDGRALKIDARRLLGVAKHDMVVARGKAAKDKSGNIALIADGVFVRQ